jgi:hypothetical protein
VSAAANAVGSHPPRAFLGKLIRRVGRKLGSLIRR